MKAYIDEEQDLDFLLSLVDKMCSAYLFMEPVDGCDLIINELYKFSLKSTKQIRQISVSLSEYINIYNIESRRDEGYKWTKLCDIAEILTSYSSTKEYAFLEIHNLILLPFCEEKTQKVDEIIQKIVTEITSGLKNKLGKYFGNDTLMMSLRDSLTLQRDLEGQARVKDIVRSYSRVILSQKRYDLVRDIQRQEADLYPDFEEELLQKMELEYLTQAEESKNRVGEKPIKDLVETHKELIQCLDSQSKPVQSYLFFLKFVDMIRELFTEEDDITARFDLKEIYDLYKQDLLVEELFSRTRKFDSYDHLIYELRNNVFIFTDVDREYLIIKNAITCLLKKWTKAVVNNENEGKKFSLTLIDLDKIVSMIIQY